MRCTCAVLKYRFGTDGKKIYTVVGNGGCSKCKGVGHVQQCVTCTGCGLLLGQRCPACFGSGVIPLRNHKEITNVA